MKKDQTKKRKFHIKKGDTVQVLTGVSKGQQGRVLSVDPDQERAYVEGVNMGSRHKKPSPQNPQGGIQQQEGSVHISNLMLVDPKSGEPTRVGRTKDENGKSVRYSKKSGETIKDQQ